MGRLRHPLPRPSTNSGALLGDGVNASTCQVAEAVGAANEEESIWKMRRHASGDLAETREPLYWYLNMRRAGTMGGPFLLRRLSAVGGEPGPLVFVGEGNYPTGVLLIPFEAVESFDMGPAAKAIPG